MTDPWGSIRPRRRTSLLRVAVTQLALLVVGAVLVGAVAAVARGLRAADDPGVAAPTEIASAMAALDRRLTEARGELDVTRLQLERATEIMKYSSRYEIPADLSATIYDIALAEGIHPSLGFQLVRVESRFRPLARSPKGAIGYTQIRLPTARGYDRDITEAKLANSEVNLRLGFRFLKYLLKRFDNNLHLALLAYNRGPTLVDSIVSAGGDPSNGYSETVMLGLKLRAVRRGS